MGQLTELAPTTVAWMAAWQRHQPFAESNSWAPPTANCTFVGEYPSWEGPRRAPGKSARRLDKEWILCWPPPPTCVVASVGIGLDWHFDVAAEAAGCEVHSFDPTKDLASRHHADARTFKTEGRRISFHKVGLGTSTTYSGEYGKRGLTRVMHLDEMLDTFVGPGRDVTVLKVDCEGCEWEELLHLVTNAPTTFCRVSNALQFEVHFTENFKLHNASLALLLFEHIMVDHGFRVFPHVGVNGAGTKWNFPPGLIELAPGIEKYGCCYNIRFVRESPGRVCSSSPIASGVGPKPGLGVHAQAKAGIAQATE